MHLFLIVSMPLAYIYLLILRDQSGRTPAMTAISALKGALAYLVVLVPLLAMRRFVQEPFSGPGLYFYSTVHDFVLPTCLGLLLYLWFTSDAGGLTPDERFVSVVSFLAGAFTLGGVMDLFLRADHFGVYELFHLPALRVGLVLLTGTLTYQFSSETLWLRYVYLVLILAAPFAFGVVQMLVAMSFALAGAGVTVGLFALSWVLALFWAGSRPSFRFR